MAGFNRFRSVSLTQQLPITSARNARSDSFNNSIDDLVAFLGSLQSIKREAERELLQATTKDSGSESVESHNLKIRLKEINATINQLEKRLKVLQQIGQSQDNSHSTPPAEAQAQSPATASPIISISRSKSAQNMNEPVAPVLLAQKSPEPYSPSRRSRSNTASTFSSGENFIQSIDSIKFTNIPEQSQANLQVKADSQLQPHALSKSYSHSHLQSQTQLQNQGDSLLQKHSFSQLQTASASSLLPTSENSSTSALPNITFQPGIDSLNTSAPLSKTNSANLSSPTSKHSSFDNLIRTSSITNEKPRGTPTDSEDEEDGIKATNNGSPTWLLSDILQSIGANKDQDEYFLVSRGNDLVTLFSQYSHLKKDLVLKTFISKILFMLCHPVSEVRATGYRISRYIISDYDSLTTLVQSKILIFIIITMSRSNCEIEKEQALKLVRGFISIPRGANNLSIGVIKSILAIIENEDLDPNVEDESKLSNFKNICIETILEIALIKTELIFLSGGFRVIFQVIQDGTIDLAISCILCLNQILDSKSTRVFLRDGYDLSGLTSIFAETEEREARQPDNDNEGEGPIEVVPLSSINNKAEYKNSIHKIRRSAFLLCLFLKSWNGIMAFSQDDFQSWKVLVSTLKRPNDQVRDVVLDLLNDILRISPVPWVKNSSIGEAISKFQRLTGSLQGNYTRYSELDPNSLEYSILNHYIGLLLDILVNKCDIMEFLSSLIEENPSSDLAKKAEELVRNIYVISYRLFPKELLDASKLLPNNSITIAAFTSSYISKEMHKENGANGHSHSSIRMNNTEKFSEIKKYVNSISIDSRYNMDEIELKEKIAKSRVLTVKEYDEWNWMQLSEIIQGPLRNPKKFEDILKNVPKFMKRIMSFYRPFKFRFCNTPVATDKRKGSRSLPPSHVYVTVGCQLFDALLSTDEGTKYLSSNKIIPQLSETFAQVDPFSGIEAKEPILSRKRLKKTLSHGYIDFVGVLSKYPHGIKILNQWQFFNILHHILEASVLDIPNHQHSAKYMANDSVNKTSSFVEPGYNYNNQQYLIILLLSKLDFSSDSPLRVVLSKALTICSLDIKIYIMENILLDKLLKIPECERWVIKLMVHRLYDVNEFIRDIAIETIYNFCNVSDDNLKFVISLKPSVNMLKAGRKNTSIVDNPSSSFKGEALIMKFLSTSEGFKFVDEIGYIDKEFKEWVEKRNKDYSVNVALRIEQILFPYIIRGKGEEPTKTHGNKRDGKNTSKLYTFDIPIHFFSSLLQTEEGLIYFQQYQNKKFLDDMLSETQDIKVHIEYKYSSMEGAFELEDENVLSEIQEMLTKLRENLWILGSIASSPYGIQLLDPEYNRTLRIPIIPIMIDLVSNFPYWHIRGIALYQLGRIASTVEGTEILDEFNWVSSFDRFNNPISICYPGGENRLQKVFNVEISNPYKDSKYYTVFGGGAGTGVGGSIGEGAIYDLLDDYDMFDTSMIKADENTNTPYLSEEDVQKYHNRVLTLITYLSAVLGKIERKASKELILLKQNIPELFASPILFSKVIKLVDKGRYKLRVRRFLFSLFLDTRILEMLVRKEKKIK